jgi:hypothetical protein
VPVDLLLDRGHPIAEAFRHLLQVLNVDANPRRLHPGQDRRQRHLDLVQQAPEPGPVDPLLEHRREESHGGRRPPGAPRRVGEELALSLSLDLPQHVQAQILATQLLEGIRGLGRIQ